MTPLQALDYIIKNFLSYEIPKDEPNCVAELKIIENALKRLEEIDNRPFAFVVSNRYMEDAIVKEISKHKEIKITNLADQKKLKAFEIIKAKRLDVNELIDLMHHKDKYILLDEYNECVFTNPITKEELDLFSEVL